MAEFKQKANYGVDAPGLMRFHFVAGAMSLAAALILFALILVSVPKLWHGWAATAFGFLFVAGLYCLGMGCLMIYWSRVYKLAECERLLDRLDFRGDEHVLDAGCGGGMMMIRAARRLPAGHAVGIDLWQACDQSNNHAQTPLHNAEVEGVADRVEILTGDIRQLPFPDASFDVVVSHWVVHNIADSGERKRALAEMARALKPGGKLLIADIMHLDEYANELRRLNFKSVVRFGPGLQERIFGLLTYGNVCPASVLAVL